MNPRGSRWLVAGGLMLVLGIGAWWWRGSGTPPVVARRPADPSRVAAVAPAKPAKPAAAVAAVEPDTVQLAAIAARLMPGGPKASKARHDMLVENAYALSRLQFDAARTEQLKILLVERNKAQADAREAYRQMGGGPQGEAAAVNEAARRVDEEIRRALGEEAYAEWLGLANESNYRNMVAQNYAPVLLDAGVPLTHDQIDQLAVVFADVGYRDPAGRAGEARTVDPNTGLRPIDERFLRRAAAVMSPAQLTAYRQALLQQHARTAARLRGQSPGP